MADRILLREEPKHSPIERENWRKLQQILNSLADEQNATASAVGASSGVSSVKRLISELRTDFETHQQDISNFDHQVTHAQALTAAGTTGNTDTDHDDRYYTAEGTEHPSTNTPWSLRTDIVGLGSGAVSLGADAITTDTSNFDNNLSAADDTVQKALDTIDDLSIGGGSGVDPYATNIEVDTAGFSNNLSAVDDTVQKALETLDELSAGGGGSSDGWNEISDALTYASSTTFTVAGDKTTTYQKGTKIKLTQTTEKYFYVTAASYSAPNTTVTITAGDDYSLANAAITSPYYSYTLRPQGFPMLFSYTPSVSASGSMTTSSVVIANATFALLGQLVYVAIQSTFTIGGSVNKTVYFTLPVESKYNYARGYGAIVAVSLTELALVTVEQDTPDKAGIRRADSSNWTAGTGKAASFTCIYEIE